VPITRSASTASWTSQWAAWFDGLQVSDDGEETVISGLLTDQPALHGLLAKIRDLGLPDLRAPAGHGRGRKRGIVMRPRSSRSRRPGRSAVRRDDDTDLDYHDTLADKFLAPQR
jgi:hypothetical protein